MKVLLLALAIALVGCASGPKKTETKKVEKKVTEAAKTEMKKMETKKEEKKMAAKTDSKVKGAKKVTCSAGDNVRTLENSFSDGGGCEVLYTKNGETNAVASASNELDYCQEVVDRIAGKLEGAGFKCEL